MIVAILGLPGSGKSTLAQTLKELPGAVYAHPGKFAVATGLVSQKRPQRDELAAVPNLAEAFFAHVSAHLTASLLIMDGFPRTREQAKKLVETGWDVHTIHLIFPPRQERALSVARQQKRVDAEGVTDLVAHSSLFSQTDFAIEHDLAAIEELRSHGAIITDIDATQTVDEVLQKVLALLKLESVASSPTASK